jgi:hypothetical protein
MKYCLIKMNTIYKKLRALLAIISQQPITDEMILDAMERAGTPVAKSRLHGWRVGRNHKHFRPMSRDDLLAVLEALINYFKGESK